MKTILLGITFLLLLSGCATTPIPATKAQFVPTDRIFRTEILPAKGNARAVFVRDVGAYGSGMNHHLFIDGRKAASLAAGEKVEFVLTPGEHIFGVIPTDPWGKYSLNTIDQDLKSGKQYFYRVFLEENHSAVQRYIPEEE